MSEATSLGDALEQINRIWDTEDNIFVAYDHPLHETDEDLLYRQELKDLQLKHSVEYLITNTISACALKENVSLNAEGGRIEKVITSPRTVLQAKTRYDTALGPRKLNDVQFGVHIRCSGMGLWRHMTPLFKAMPLRPSTRTTSCRFGRTQPMLHHRFIAILVM